jgi:hypothetical protein
MFPYKSIVLICKNKPQHIDFWPKFISFHDLILIGGVLMAWSRLSGYGIHCDIVNPRLLELQAAKEILAEIYDIQIQEVEDLIQQKIVDFSLMWEWNLGCIQHQGHVYHSEFIYAIVLYAI